MSSLKNSDANFPLSEMKFSNADRAPLSGPHEVSSINVADFDTALENSVSQLSSSLQVGQVLLASREKRNKERAGAQTTTDKLAGLIKNRKHS